MPISIKQPRVADHAAIADVQLDTGEVMQVPVGFQVYTNQTLLQVTVIDDDNLEYRFFVAAELPTVSAVVAGKIYVVVNGDYQQIFGDFTVA